MQPHMQTSLVKDALLMACWRRRPAKGLIFHSDRGSQGGFNRSSQHPHQGGVYGATRRMDEAIDWQRRHALSWGSFASARS
jgi:putative transposase